MNTNQIIICTVLFTILAAAIYSFLKTPPEQRFSKPIERIEGLEYAPLYSNSERLKLLVIHVCCLIPCFLFSQFYFFPTFKEFSEHAECHEIASINGVKLVFFGLFVGLPLVLAFSLFLLEGLRSIRAFKAAQHPPPNEKTFTLTPYKYGRAAKVTATIPFLFILFLLCFCVWGGYQANSLTKVVKPCELTGR
ncbi:MAG: hypothetical protein JWQ09_2206 [Segetibacter sp.]|nr:hypothetical protein [Segetibacter sp.]